MTGALFVALWPHLPHMLCGSYQFMDQSWDLSLEYTEAIRSRKRQVRPEGPCPDYTWISDFCQKSDTDF